MTDEKELAELLDRYCGKTCSDDTVHYSRAAVIKAMRAAEASGYQRGMADAAQHMR